MAELDINKADRTDFTNTETKFEVTAEAPDRPDDYTEETYYDFPNAPTHLGYYKQIPEIKSALLALATWTTGKGWTADPTITAKLENFIGWGEDDFSSIIKNLLIQKKVFGDAFAEIVRTDDGRIINLKPLYTGDMRVVVDRKGMIKRYELRTQGKSAKPQKFQPQDILHLVNDRIANEIHGTSIIDVLKNIIDAKNEALADERKIRHRELALGILEIDEDDTTKINNTIDIYQKAVNNGEVLVLPKGTAELKDNPATPRDRLQWLQYLDNLFYQVVGIPKVMVTSEGFTEAGGKVGYLTFEPTYTKEQLEIENDIWNKLALRVKFNRPPSLLGHVQSSENKNTGQTGFQESETQVTPNRTE